MFCYQCQEALKGEGCIKKGVCGKTADTADMQDLLIYVMKGISAYSLKAEEIDIDQKEVNEFILKNLFATITNVNFDKEYFMEKVKEGIAIREELKEKIVNNNANLPEIKHDSLSWKGSKTEELEEKAAQVGILSTENEDIRSLREMITYALKGIAAYAEHAGALGYHNNDVYKFIKEALVSTIDDSLSVDDLVKLALDTGKCSVEVMEVLDKANTSAYGNPEITKVNIGVRNNPGILISGHDLKDLEELLEQTKGTGIDVYTHCEMLPANYYPYFKKYDNFVGNYGNAWWKQNSEFELFNGPIILTTNCLVPPKDSYIDRLFTTGSVGYKGVKHIADRKNGEQKDFSEVIEKAKECSAPAEIEKGEIVGGFAHEAVLSLADKVVEAVKSGAVKRFIVMAGCDGRMKSRQYYTDFAKALPEDTIILTAGCAKYKFIKLDLGDIGGIPRILDAGQCNDSYSLAVIALKLKEVFELDDINELPISYNISWYEQKAVTVLLALLYLGVKNIHLGPTLPAFLSPNVTKVLVDNFGIKGITNVEDDMKELL
jgi:hydroxylamine reductase